MPKIVVKAECPKCKKYYELDCELKDKEILLRNRGKIPCPLCEEEKRSKLWRR